MCGNDIDEGIHSISTETWTQSHVKKLLFWVVPRQALYHQIIKDYQSLGFKIGIF